MSVLRGIWIPFFLVKSRHQMFSWCLTILEDRVKLTKALISMIWTINGWQWPAKSMLYFDIHCVCWEEMSIWLCVVQHVLYHSISSVVVHVYIFGVDISTMGWIYAVRICGLSTFHWMVQCDGIICLSHSPQFL